MFYQIVAFNIICAFRENSEVIFIAYLLLKTGFHLHFLEVKLMLLLRQEYALLFIF